MKSINTFVIFTLLFASNISLAGSWCNSEAPKMPQPQARQNIATPTVVTMQVTPIIPTTTAEQITALHDAVRADNFDRVRDLLSGGVSANLRDPGNHNRTPLFLATTADMRALLLSRQADPMLVDDLGQRPNMHSRHQSSYMNFQARELPQPLFRDVHGGSRYID
jgi:hypothetical protein